MSGVIYASLQLWDPLGQMKIAPGRLYGGQSMVFVLAAEGLESGLLRLLDRLAEKGLGLVRVLYAGDVASFEEDHFPFAVDIAAMAADARASGEICALGPFTYEPAAAPESAGVMLACAELRDPRRAAPYAGEICLAAAPGTVADGLRALIAHVARQGLRLASLEDVKDASEHSEVFDFEASVEEMVARARGARGPVLSDRIEYQHDA